MKRLKVVFRWSVFRVFGAGFTVSASVCGHGNAPHPRGRGQSPQRDSRVTKRWVGPALSELDQMGVIQRCDVMDADPRAVRLSPDAQSKADGSRHPRVSSPDVTVCAVMTFTFKYHLHGAVYCGFCVCVCVCLTLLLVYSRTNTAGVLGQ